MDNFLEFFSTQVLDALEDSRHKTESNIPHEILLWTNQTVYSAQYDRHTQAPNDGPNLETIEAFADTPQHTSCPRPQVQALKRSYIALIETLEFMITSDIVNGILVYVCQTYA